VVLHAPPDAAAEAVAAVREAAEAAGRRLFGDSPVRFPMQCRVVEAYDQH
jgi:alkanesulfonate monooxygenase SsuD/methylene tetrahydromethanopterin reductase-like flavin-dependent oxidoreductase (luciferase family)